ncbi:unnamed protein product [marine sediment metagenome]|uniref:Uncharacterized protein n=1 Tax=marine sediment metagenome TaxID=412755 RepID=X0W3C8_9ZZZZ
MDSTCGTSVGVGVGERLGGVAVALGVGIGVGGTAATNRVGRRACRDSRITSATIGSRLVR